MMAPRLATLTLLVQLTLMPVSAQRYAAQATTEEGIKVIRLEDRVRQTVVSVAPSIGNNAYEMLVKGENVFWFPYDSVAQFARQPRLCGNPLLAPWANRFDEDGFYANGKYYQLNAALGNLRRDGHQLPIHGLLLFASQWQVVSLEADGQRARVTSRLDFSRYPNWMAQFPFAHELEVTYALQDGALEVATRIHNKSAESMPIVMGYHPYFQIHDAPRDRWRVALAAQRVWSLTDRLIPTGETTPIEDLLADPSNVSLQGTALDNVFGGLVRDSAGRAHFSVQGERQKIEVVYGPKYTTAVVYAPQGPDRDFICFEPMSGITNAFNLAHRGLYKDLQTIASGESWQESFWVQPSGF